MSYYCIYLHASDIYAGWVKFDVNTLAMILSLTFHSVLHQGYLKNGVGIFNNEIIVSLNPLLYAIPNLSHNQQFIQYPCHHYFSLIISSYFIS